MNIHDVTKLSGLSRGQVDQAISRYGLQPQGGYERGGGRTFTPADAFLFAVAGRLARLGMTWPAIVEALPLAAKIDPATYEQAEIFPGQAEFTEREEDAFFVVRHVDKHDAIVGEIVTREGMFSLVGLTGGAAIVINATQVAAAVEAATRG